MKAKTRQRGQRYYLPMDVELLEVLGLDPDKLALKERPHVVVCKITQVPAWLGLEVGALADSIKKAEEHPLAKYGNLLLSAVLVRGFGGRMELYSDDFQGEWPDIDKRDLEGSIDELAKRCEALNELDGDDLVEVIKLCVNASSLSEEEEGNSAAPSSPSPMGGDSGGA